MLLHGAGDNARECSYVLGPSGQRQVLPKRLSELTMLTLIMGDDR